MHLPHSTYVTKLPNHRAISSADLRVDEETAPSGPPVCAARADYAQSARFVPRSIEETCDRRFRHRCPLRAEVCETHPDLMTVNDSYREESHAARCWRSDLLLAEEESASQPA